MGKTALITGASRGIGLEIARKFAAERTDYTTLVLIARASDAFRDNVKALTESASRDIAVAAYEADLTHHAMLPSLVETIYEEQGNVDLLVNNAGYTNPVPLQQIEFDDFQRTVVVNLYAPFILVQSLLQRGNKFETIVNVASTAGINGRAGWLTYSASKAAMINMSQVMREELSLFGTRVVCISPGRCATDLRHTLAPDEDLTTIMQPQSVAEVVSMLASDVGRFVDSANIVVRQ